MNERRSGTVISRLTGGWWRRRTPTTVSGVLAICGVLAAALAPARTGAAELLAGAAIVDITPDVKASKIPLGGYAARRGAPATGVHDRVYARALALSSGRTRVAIVSIDLCFLPANVKQEVYRRVKAQAPEWEADQLFLAATHTHSGPDPLAMHTGNTFKLKGWTPFDAQLLSFTTERIASAIVKAGRAMRPAAISATAAPVTGLNRNRRGEPTTDPMLTAIKVTGADGKPIAEIVDFASHPTLYGDEMTQVSADWPGIMEADVQTATGGDSVCLFLNGAEGDASPAGVDSEKGDEKV
ncbi:MAG TPA: neutral/alkaline non-lysosomal ceramidase N-terminal domain-containing protein, partial [Chthonomonadaceae bacterium]|nr:neutral/alkaline non-lysosomal ceramidase N-terminal domain-containing protein [Chthonomonadaceae bacterium]